MSKIEFVKKLDKTALAMKRIPVKVGVVAVNFSKERFRRQNWVDNTTRPWKKRKHNNDSRTRINRAILTALGRLKRSVRKVFASQKRVIIGTDVPYAQANNEGVNKIVAVKAHTRSRTNGRTTIRGRGVKVKAHKKKMRLPQRQFIGPSRELNKQISRMVLVELKKALK